MIKELNNSIVGLQNELTNIRFARISTEQRIQLLREFADKVNELCDESVKEDDPVTDPVKEADPVKVERRTRKSKTDEAE